MVTETLRQVFKTLADPTRLRLLVLLEREELAVHELMQVLGMAQSTVSRHLGILREAGLLLDRREGTSVHYRFVPPEDGDWREVWALAKRSLRDDADSTADLAALDKILERRALRTRTWFDQVGPAWDALRSVFNDTAHRARAINRLVSPDLIVADIGTGTGILARELAGLGLTVIAVDHSRRMLDAARAKLTAAEVDRIDLRQGDAGDLPLVDGEVDAAFAHMVLQHLASPAEAVAEMFRVVKPGGRVVVVDLVEHDREWMRERLGSQWLGFSTETVRAWFTQAGFVDVDIELHDVDPAGNGKSTDIPATFIATSRVPPH